MNALGLIETRGLTAAIEGADVMVKSADVCLLEKTYIGAGLVTISVIGDVAAVKSSVEAATAAIGRLQGGELVASHVIPRPKDGIADVLLISKKNPDSGNGQPEGNGSGDGQAAEACLTNEVKEASVSNLSEQKDSTAQPRASRIVGQYPDTKEERNICQVEDNLSGSKEEKVVSSSEVGKVAASKKKKATAISKQDIDALYSEHGTQKAIAALTRYTLANLRELARQYPEYTIDRKKLSKVKKRTLIEGFTRYYNSLNS